MKKHAVFLATMFALTGCNGGGDDNTSTPTVPPSPPPPDAVSQAPSLITQATIGVEKRIPIYQSVLPKAGQMLSISSVRTLSEASTASACPEPQINGLELLYTPESQGVCSYEYTVTDGATSTTGTLISSASLTGNKLPDISASGTVATELTQAMALTADETLQVVTVLGSGMAHVEDNNIIFNPQAAGLSRVVYTVSNDTASPATQKIGVLNITVSDREDGNTPPKTPDVSFTALPGEMKTFTLPITDVDVDAESQPIDNPQLISVVSSDGALVASTATTVDADYFTNKSMTFSAALPGSYTVFYTAHDHRGGYSTGRSMVSVVGEVGLLARDASFYRAPSDSPYDFKIDLRSYITAPDMSKVDYVSAVFDDATSSTIDKNPAHIIAPTKATPVLTYKYPGANATGLVAIKYTVKNAAGQRSGRVFIAIGEANIPTVTVVGATPKVDIGATVTATSTCTDCTPAKTTYQWWFGDGVFSDKNSIVVPNGVSGESLTLVATPYNAAGVRGVSKSVTYSYPFRAATITVNRDKAKKGETITYTVNTTYLGAPDAGASVTVKGLSAVNRQNVAQAAVTAQIDGAASATKTTDSSGNAVFSVTDGGPGVNTMIDAAINGHSYGSKAVTFSVVTSPDVSSANFYGHMPNQISVGEDQYQRPPLATEEDGAAGDTFTESGEVWGRITKAEATRYCATNVPTPAKLALLYNAYPSGDITTTHGWPTSAPYITQTNNDVVSLADGAQASSTGTNTVSCYMLKPIDSTGVTIDILNEDGTYTNDKFPPSSTAMTYGALMFPGAGIRVNLPDAVIPSTITVSAPAGYVKNIVGKSVELTDMVADDYRDQIITAVGENASGDFLGLRLKVSSSKYQTTTSADYIPQPSPTGIINLKRDVTFPSRDVAWYQHGLVTAQRSGAYMNTEGATPRYTAFANIVKNRFDLSVDGSSPGETAGLFSTVLLYFIPAEKNVEWLREIIGERSIGSGRTELSIRSLSDRDLLLKRWLANIPGGVGSQGNRPYRPYLVEGTTTYQTPTSSIQPTGGARLSTNVVTQRLCPGASGRYPGATRAITEFSRGTLPVNPIGLRTNASIMGHNYAGAIKGLEEAGWTTTGRNGDLLIGWAYVVSPSKAIYVSRSSGGDGLVEGNPMMVPWNEGGVSPLEWPASPRVWGFGEKHTFEQLGELQTEIIDSGLGGGTLAPNDRYAGMVSSCGLASANQWTYQGLYNECAGNITRRCAGNTESLTSNTVTSVPIFTDEDIRVGTAVEEAGTPVVEVRKFPIK